MATDEPWAATMIADGRAIEVFKIEDVVSRLASAKRVQRAGQQRLQPALAGGAREVRGLVLARVPFGG